MAPRRPRQATPEPEPEPPPPPAETPEPPVISPAAPEAVPPAQFAQPPAPPVPPAHAPPQPAGWPLPVYVPYPARPYNVLAIVSICFAGSTIIGTWCLGGIIAIITGHIARHQIRRSGEAGDGLALVGLIVGYVATGLFVAFILIYILFFVFVFAFAATHPSPSPSPVPQG